MTWLRALPGYEEPRRSGARCQEDGEDCPRALLLLFSLLLQGCSRRCRVIALNERDARRQMAARVTFVEALPGRWGW